MTGRSTSQPAESRRRLGWADRALLALLGVAWWQWFIAVSTVSAGAYASQEIASATPHREVFWNIEAGWAVYVMLAMLFAAVLYGPYRRIQVWSLGRSSPIVAGLPQTIRARVTSLLTQGLTTRRVPRYHYAGVMHMCIFVSFIALTIITALVALDDDTPLDFLHGDFYLWYSAAGDFFGIVGLIGVGMALYARFGRPSAMRRVRWEQRNQDYVITIGFGLLLISGLLTEAMRVGATELNVHDDWARWSFIAYAISSPLDSAGVSAGGFETAHLAMWWFHVPASFLWLGYIGYSKLGHILYAPANSFLKTPGPYGKLAKIEDFESLETFGAGKITDFTWKQLFELDVCVRCGRCTDVCPAATAGQPLSPMHIIQDLKEHMNRSAPALLNLAAVTNGDSNGHQHELEPMVGGAVKDEALWACRTCGACVQECPVFIEHVPTIVDMRRWLVMDEARMPETVQATLTNLEQRGHPWRGTALTRTSWIEGMDVEVPEFTGEQEYLYWVGCSGALVERNVPITQAVARLLTEAGVSFGVLGAGEGCNGDPARRLGHEYLYQMLAEAAIEQMNGLGVQEDRDAVPPLLQHVPQRIPRLRRQVRGHPPRAAAGAARRRWPAAAEGGQRRDDHVSRLLLSGAAERRLRCPSRRAQGDSRHQPCRDAAQPRSWPLLRRGRRQHVDGGEDGAARQPRAHRGSGGHRRRHRRDGLPLLHPDVRRRHPVDPGRGRAEADAGARHRRAARSRRRRSPVRRSDTWYRGRQRGAERRRVSAAGRRSAWPPPALEGATCAPTNRSSASEPGGNE